MPASPASTPAPEVIAFGAFHLDLRSGRLMRDAASIALRPKTWSVLLYLVERPGTLISREELLDAVWPDVAVTPDTLTKSIGELRAALGDDTREPRYIETVHRRGFRFLGMPRRTPDGAVPASAESTPPACVGRTAELRRLIDCVDRAVGGERQVVFVSGPAGVGKTTLVEALLRSPALQGRAARVGCGASVEQYGTREAYMPLLEALERLARGPDAEEVAARLRRTAPSWLAQMPWLAADDPALLAGALQAARPERMLREGVALLEALAADTPLILALEDLHWSDPSTVDLLGRIAQRREPAHLMIVVTYRAAEVAVYEHPLGAAVRGLRGRRRCVELPVHELSAAAVQLYLEARFPGAVPPVGLAEVLHAHTDGNPLFLRAVVDHMLVRGWILDTAPGWSFAAMPASPDFGVPDDVRHMVAMQIDSLAPTDRRLLEAAAVAGGDCAPGTLAAALERPLDEVEASCDVLASGARFLRSTGSATAPRFTFTHELYRQAVYEDVAPARRRRLHARIGDALEAELGERAHEIAPLLAHQFIRGGDVERGVRYLALAAARARQRAAPREAGDYLEQALGLVDRLADAGARRRSELDLRVALAQVAIERDGPASGALQEQSERALALCDETDAPRLRFQILYAVCHVHSMRGDAARYDAAIGSLDDLARRLGSAELRLLADSVHCRTAVYRADFAGCCRYWERIAAAVGRGVAPPRSVVGADPVIASRTHAALSAWMLGRFEPSRAAMRAAAAAAATPDVTPFTQCAVGTVGCLLGVLAGEAELVRHGCDPAVELAEEHGFAHWRTIAMAMRGWARVRLGEVGAGIDEIQDAGTAYAETGAQIFRTYILAFLAEAHLRAGAVAAGLRAVDEALRIAETTLDRSYVPELWRLKGELLLAAGARHGREAETCLDRAIAVARASHARALELRAALSLARLWDAGGRGAHVPALLAAALTGLDTHVDVIDVREARAALGGRIEAPAEPEPRGRTRRRRRISS